MKFSIHLNLNFTNALWMILLVGEIKINLMTCFENAIISDLNRATRIASFPAYEIPKIKQKFLNADYRHRFINSAINNF